jgi:hypothetical protein
MVLTLPYFFVGSVFTIAHLGRAVLIYLSITYYKPPTVNFLFNSTIFYSGDQVKYKVYEFKLHPGRYKAELATTNGAHNIKEVVFFFVDESPPKNKKIHN